MTKSKLLIVCMAGMLFSCGQTETKKQNPRAIKIEEVLPLGTVNKSFSGVVSSDQFSDLAFKMSGPLIALHVDAGQKVKKGDIVAEIDPQDFKWEYEAKKASFQTAKAQLERAKRLLEKQAISRQEYESTEAAYSNAEAAFNYAENMLEQTKLKAPFDGFIQKKYVENYQKVQAGQGIVCLINPNRLLVQFTMPETNMSYLTSPHLFTVEFDNYKGKFFKAKIKDLVQASPDGSGLPVFLNIDDPDFNLKQYDVAVGFSCRVVLHIENEAFGSSTVMIPLSSIIAGTTSKDRFVFVYNPSTGSVEQRVVKTEGLVGKDKVVISEGLKAGEKIVVAGVTRLTDGQQVTLLTE